MVYRLEPFWLPSPILIPFSSSDSRPRDSRSIVVALLCGSPLERRTFDLFHPFREICRDSVIYDFLRQHNYLTRGFKFHRFWALVFA